MSLLQRAIRSYRRRGLQYLLVRAGSLAFHKLITPVESLLLFIYRLKDVSTGICESGIFPLREPALYRLDPPHETASPYYYWFPLPQLRYRPRITFDYETEVLEELADLAKNGGTLWEVGSAWGYHSLAFAPAFDEVVCFEQKDEFADVLATSIETNEYTNMRIVREHVDSLDQYLDGGQPAVVLMDIDGWEYSVISSSLKTLEADPVWIVELHNDPGGVPSEVVKPEKVVSLFEEYDYEVTVINERGSMTRFGKERKDLNNWHIVARPTEEPSRSR